MNITIIMTRSNIANDSPKPCIYCTTCFTSIPTSCWRKRPFEKRLQGCFVTIQPCRNIFLFRHNPPALWQVNTNTGYYYICDYHSIASPWIPDPWPGSPLEPGQPDNKMSTASTTWRARMFERWKDGQNNTWKGMIFRWETVCAIPAACRL